MNSRKLILFLFLLVNAFCAFADGSFYLYKKNISYPEVSFGRDVYVYLPDGYDGSLESYPVLYMHDGQNLFDPSRAFLGQTWNAQNTLNDLIRRKIISPIIVVAIDNTQARMEEYIPEKQADAYLEFLLNTIKPAVDRNFRTKREAKFTGILGSSLGGLVSLYAGLKYANKFGLIGALSPSIWVNQRSILAAYQASITLPYKVYLDSGTAGGEEPQNVLDFAQVLKSRGYQNSQTLFTYIQNGALHSEVYWAQRLPLALKFFYHL